MLDSSVMGMGKGAGNLNTELLLEHLNLYYGKKYQIQPLLELIDRVIKVIREEFYWGYSVEYYLSSINHCTPSYASHFYNKHMLPIDKVSELLGKIDEVKKISFDKDYAENLYLSYNEQTKYDDSEAIEKLRLQLQGKKVLLIATGKTLVSERNKILEYANRNDIVSFSLNNFEFDTDFVFITRSEMLDSAFKKTKNVIVPSNLAQQEKSAYRIEYKRWIKLFNGKTFDSSGVMLLNLLNEIKPSEIFLAGFDGYSSDINENYFDYSIRRPLNSDEKKTQNVFFKNFINELRKANKISFVTKSLYEEEINMKTGNMLKITGGGINVE